MYIILSYKTVNDDILYDRNVGKIVFNREEDEEMEILYKIISYKKMKTGKNEETIYSLQPLNNNKDNDEILEVDDGILSDNYMFVPPPHVRNRWERYQNQFIQEGVYMTVAEKTLQDHINTQIDIFAAQEPIDYHPNSNEIVRDLIHPSLYPLIINPSKVDTTKHNYWNRIYEPSRFQWLPSEVKIDRNCKAKFISPINNLDMEKYPELTQSLEEVLTALIPGFEKV